MKVELFVSHIDLDIFSAPSTLNGGWKKIYKDVESASATRLPSSGQIGTYEWDGRVFIRRENNGGLLYHAKSGRVFSLSRSAFLALAWLWASREADEIVPPFSKSDIDDLFKQLSALGLLQPPGQP